MAKKNTILISTRMKKRFKSMLLISILIIGSLTSCDKHYAKKLSGTYDCKVDYHYSDISGTHVDSTYFEEVEVIRDIRSIIVFDHKIAVDELRGEQEYYEGSYSQYMTVQFIDDELHIQRYSGGQGGNSSRTFIGTKK